MARWLAAFPEPTVFVLQVQQTNLRISFSEVPTREFPGGPVVRTPRFHFHCRGPELDPSSRELRSCKLCSVAKKKERKKYQLNFHCSQWVMFPSLRWSLWPGELDAWVGCGPGDLFCLRPWVQPWQQHTGSEWVAGDSSLRS